MKKILLALGLILIPVAANALSVGVEVAPADRCAANMKLTEANAKDRNFTKYMEITDRVQRETIIDIIAKYPFGKADGQIFPNVSVEKIGVMESANGGLLVVFADKDMCVWSYYIFTERDKAEFFNRLARQGA